MLLSFVVGPIILRAEAGIGEPGSSRRHAGFARDQGRDADDGWAHHPQQRVDLGRAVGALQSPHPYLYVAVATTLWMGLIGFVDDVLKLRQKRRGERTDGLVEKYKLVGQVTAGLALGWYLLHYPLQPNLPAASTSLPFFKYYIVIFLPGFAWAYVAFTTFILTGTSNAVNITDGLDGLAAGLSAIAFGTFAIFATSWGGWTTPASCSCRISRIPAS